MLYRNIVEPNHVNCGVIQNAVEDVLERAANLYGEAAVDRCGLVDIHYYDKGRSAGTSAFWEDTSNGEQTSLVQFSMELVERDVREMVGEIVPHEVAHILCFANGWDDGHGRVWKSMCKTLGGNGDRRHSMATTDGRSSGFYEAIGPEGKPVWLTLTQYKQAHSRGIYVRDSEGNRFALTREHLKGKVIQR